MKKKEKSKKEKRRNIFLDIFEFLVEGVHCHTGRHFLKAGIIMRKKKEKKKRKSLLEILLDLLLHIIDFILEMF